MNLYLHILLFTFCISSSCFAQKNRIGVQVGNTISLPGSSVSDQFQDRMLIRYSIGIFGRQNIANGFKGRFIAPIRKGMIDMDYGATLVFKGFDYTFGGVAASRDQVSIEFPLLFNYYDTRNVFMPRRLRRKGISTFFRMGIKPTFSFRQKKGRTIQQLGESVIEEISVATFNLLGTLGGGVQQHFKSGDVAFFELSINVGLLQNLTGVIRYQKNNQSQSIQENYQDRGSYIALNVGYLLHWKTDKESKHRLPPPIIYNPRDL